MKAQPIRVWDKQRQKMTYLPPLMPMVISNGCFGVFSTIPVPAPQAPTPLIVVDPSQFVIMHGTGRKDMTGVSLFDGDIVDGTVEIDFGDEQMPVMAMKKRGLVGWSDELAGWAILIPENTGDASKCTAYEVDFASSVKLGNLFETPAILKGEIPPAVPRETLPETTVTEISDCCNAAVEATEEVNPSSLDGKTKMYTCRTCHNACTVHSYP